MPYEQVFGELLDRTQQYTNLDVCCSLIHPMIKKHYIEVDALCQKGNTIFVFEGKTNNITDAWPQLKDRFLSLSRFTGSYVSQKRFAPYNKIRLFAYKIRGPKTKWLLLEFNEKGGIIAKWLFTGLNELLEILRNL